MHIIIIIIFLVIMFIQEPVWKVPRMQERLGDKKRAGEKGNCSAITWSVPH